MSAQANTDTEIEELETTGKTTATEKPGQEEGTKKTDSTDSAAKPDAGAAAPVKPVVPEKYELKLPKDSLLDAGSVEKIASFAKERGFSQDQAQALVERESGNAATLKGSQEELLQVTREQWLTEAKEDPEIGGENFGKNAELAKRIVHRFGTDALRTELDNTGLGNHPELLRLLARIGKQMSEDTLRLPGEKPADQKSAAEILYDKTPAQT